MQSGKFGEDDREKVRKALESHFMIDLAVHEGRKYFKDRRDRKYLVVGGTQTWHGVPQKVLDDYEPDGVLVIAKKNEFDEAMSVYVGLLSDLGSRRALLSKTAGGDYQFHIEINSSGSLITIKEIEGLSFRRVLQI